MAIALLVGMLDTHNFLREALLVHFDRWLQWMDALVDTECLSVRLSAVRVTNHS